MSLYKKSFVALSGVLLILLAYIVIGFYCLENDDYDRNQTLIEPFYTEETGTIDGIIIGSSAVYRYWLPPEAFDKTGMTVYAYSTIGTPFNAFDEMADEVLKYHSPKFIAFELRPLLRKPSTYTTDNITYITDYMKSGRNRNSIIRGYITMKAKHLSIASLYSGDYNYPEKRGRVEEAKEYVEKTSRYKGAKPYFGKDSVNLKEPEYTRKISELKFGYEHELNQLLEYVETLNCEVLFLSTPWIISEENQMEMNAAIRTIENAGYPVINMNTEEAIQCIRLDFDNDFYDSRHVNIKGQYKVTHYLMRILRNKYRTEDHRGDSLYDSWKKSYGLLRTQPHTRRR